MSALILVAFEMRAGVSRCPDPPRVGGVASVVKVEVELVDLVLGYSRGWLGAWMPVGS